MARPDSNPNAQIAPSAVVVSRYNETVTSVMLGGAIGAYLARGGAESDLAVLEAPGAYELISIANAAAISGLYGTIVCLGCVIKGETSHDQHIGNAVANGLANISIKTGLPVAFGLLTTNTNEQAIARAGGDKGNKGAEAMNAALDAVDAIAMIAKAQSNNTPGVRFTPGLSPNDKLSSHAQETH
ncbi:MAG: 6,7-dimethyl-8-ribityllumazine synthase [Phycisphaerales bacterium]|nr:6,7-dimethyl-8-ribityllumazine synthase [Phycisphaerales bacterium]